MPVGADFGQTTDMIIKNPDLNSKATPVNPPCNPKRCSMVFVVGRNAFAGNPKNVRTIKHSASVPSATLYAGKAQKVN